MTRSFFKPQHSNVVMAGVRTPVRQFVPVCLLTVMTRLIPFLPVICPTLHSAESWHRH